MVDYQIYKGNRLIASFRFVSMAAALQFIVDSNAVIEPSFHVRFQNVILEPSDE